MHALRWLLIGAVTAIGIVGLVVVVALKTFTHSFGTNAPPTPLESWTARQARSMATPHDLKRQVNPIPDSPTVLKEARAHWADHCASCHGNDGRGQSEIGKHLYPPSPDMTGAETQRLADGELFSIIQNGIRLSGMPAWGGEHSGDSDSWKLVRLIRHLPQLSTAELQEMERLNPKTPSEMQEEKEEEQFLKGQPSSQPLNTHHH